MKKIYLILLFILAILTVGMVSANDNATNPAPNIEVPEKIWKDGDNSITIDTENQANIDISGSITYNSTVNPGKTSIPIKNLSTGRHSITVNSTNILKEYNITVMKENPDWNMDFDCLGEGERLYGHTVDHEMIDYPFVLLNAPEGLTGNFTMYLDGEVYWEWNAQEYREDTFYYNAYLEPKTYNFTLEYSGDDYFHPAVKTKIIKFTTTLITIPKEVVYGYDDTIYIISEYDFSNANISIKVNNKTVFKKSKYTSYSESAIKYKLSQLEANNTYDIEVDFSSDYMKKTESATVNVKSLAEDYVKFDGALYSNDKFKFTYGDKDSMFYLDSPKLNLKIRIDGKKVDSTYEYEKYIVDISDLTPGTHRIEVSYDGDKKYAKKTFFKDFEVVARAKLPDEINQHDLCNLTLNLPDDAKGVLAIDFINLENSQFNSYNAIDVDSIATISLPTEHVGNYIYKAYFNGNYELNEIAGRYFVKDSSTWQVTDDYWNMYQNENRNLTLTIPSDGSGTLTVKIEKDGKSYINTTVEVINGRCDIRLPTEHIGHYTISASFKGNYELVPYKNDYYVDSEYSIVGLDEYETHRYNSEEFVMLELPEDANGTLTLEVKYDKNSKYTTYKKVMLSEGIAKVPFPTNRIGKVYYNVLYEGNYELYNITNAEIIISPNYTYKNHVFTITGPDDLNGTVYLFEWSSGDELTCNMVNGKASIDITDYLKQKDDYVSFEMSFTSSDDESYNIAYLDDIAPIYNIKLSASDITSYYGISKSFSIKVYRNGKLVEAEKKVTIKIGSKTYYAKTNKNGIATLNITQLPGKYSIKATYKGKSITKKLVVKQTLTLKKVTIKKSAKKLVLTATFKKGKIPVKGKKIVFKFNGKKFTAKTNKKGVAKVTIKKSVLKKLKAGKKITYTATYSKNTIKKTVKVKR